MKQSRSQHRGPPRSSETYDSRPRPVAIPRRISNVRNLIAFFNTRAFQEDSGQGAPRVLRDHIPHNKVKSLVVNFNRLDTFSTSATTITSPNNGLQSMNNSVGYSIVGGHRPARGVEKQQFGKQLDVSRPATNVHGEIEEISVSGGDRRETTYKRSHEPFRSLKVWKTENGSRATSRDLQDERGTPPTQTHNARLLKEPLEEPDAHPQTVHKRRYNHKSSKHRGRNPSPTRVIESLYQMDQGWAKDGGLDRSKRPAQYQSKPLVTSQVPPPEKYQPPGAYPEIGERTTARHPNAVDRSNDGARRSGKSQDPEKENTSGTSTPKHGVTGTLKGKLLSVFKKPDSSLQQEIQYRQPVLPLHKDAHGIQKNVRDTLPSKYPQSVKTISNYGRDGHYSAKDLHTYDKGKQLRIPMTGSSPAESTLPVMGVILPKEPLPTSGSEKVGGPSYQPRTFKDIALQRRAQRMKAEQVFRATEAHEHLSVPPLRVIKAQDEPSFNIHPPRVLRMPASQETLTSFDGMSLHGPELPGVSRASGVEYPGLVGKRHNLDVEGIAIRSPSLMREMAFPKLTLRSSAKRLEKKRANKRQTVTEQHFTPRMKLRRDNEWQRTQLKTPQTNLIDGIGDTQPSVEWERLGRSASTSTSTSHDTTVSSEIVARSAMRSMNTLSLKPGSSPDSSDLGEEEELRLENGYRPMSSIRQQRSKVNFSAVTQNFPAVDRPEHEKYGPQFGDRTTILDGAVGNKRLDGDGRRRPSSVLRRKMQKFEKQRWQGSRGRAKRKAYRDRPKLMG
jgi:hypothetical protein